MWLAQGNLGAALDWLRRPDRVSDTAPLDMSPQFLILAYEHVAVAPVQVCLAQGRVSGDPAPLREALALLETQLREAASAGLPWRRIKALALQALAHEGLGARDRALDALRQALALAEPEGYIRVFADEGAPMAALAGLVLDALPARSRAADASARYVESVRDACASGEMVTPA